MAEPTITTDAQGYPIHRETCGECFGEGACDYEVSRGNPHTRIYRGQCETCRGQGSLVIEGCECGVCEAITEALEAVHV